MKIIRNVNQKQKFHTNKNTGKNVDKQCRKCKSGSIFLALPYWSVWIFSM